MCLKPITLYNKSSPFKPIYSMQVPCGKCEECLQAYQNSWFVRFYFQFQSCSKAVFFTLTYNEKSVPTLVSEDGEIYYSVYKVHIQDWIKRLRTRVSDKFKYFITSEYGPKTLRPHYHGVFFGLSQDDIHSSLYEWQQKFGFTQSRDICLSDSADLVNTSRYIAKYCNKIDDYEHPESSSKVNPTFHLISKGIGLDVLPRIKDYVLKSRSLDELSKRLKININGFEYSLPKYYKDKIFDSKSLLRSRLTDYLVAGNDKLYLAQLEQLQSENPNDSAFRILDVQTTHDNSSRAEKLRERYLRFYNNSKI